MAGDERDDADDGSEEDAGKDPEPTAEESSGNSDEGDRQKPAAWGRPLVRLDESWTKFEAWLCVVVLILEIVSLSAWVVLKGMSSPPGSGSNAGVVFRAIFAALFLGLGAYYVLKKQGVMAQRIGAIAGIFIGIYTAKYWSNVGVDYASNLLNWYQQASFLTLLGGLRGVGTRLTLMLALLGGSLATAAGKHITIDLVTRFISPKARVPVVLIGWVGAAMVCLSASWGFFDHIAIENFGARADAKPGEKVEAVYDEIGEHFFIARKQIKLDLKSTPHIVFKNEPYSGWFTGAEWNQWLDDEDFAERYGKEKIDGLKVEPDELRSPILVVPGKGEPRGELIHAANLVFPLGLLIIALRFLLRSLLVVSRHVGIDSESEDDHFDSSSEGNGGDDDDDDDDDDREPDSAKKKDVKDKSDPEPKDKKQPDETDEKEADDDKKTDDKADDEKADDKKADDEKADDKKADDEKADDEKADDKKADDKKADDKKADDEKADDEKADDKKADDKKADDEKADDKKADDEKADDKKADDKKADDKKAEKE